MTRSHDMPTTRHDRAWLMDLCAPFASATKIASDAQRIPAAELPEPFASLLDHSEHMTSTLGQYWTEPVDLEVLDLLEDDEKYVREILLRLPSDRRVVEYGVARLHLDAIPGTARSEILERRRPLGEVLIRHDVLRRIEPTGFWKFQDCACLRDRVDRPAPLAFGRTGVIHCDGEPGIELLEIVIDPGVAGA